MTKKAAKPIFWAIDYKGEITCTEQHVLIQMCAMYCNVRLSIAGSVDDIAKRCKLTPAATSKVISRLRDRGLIVEYKKGRSRYWKIPRLLGYEEAQKILNEKFNAMFDIFWEHYPRHVAKHNAQKAFIKLKPDEDIMNLILEDLIRRKVGEWADKDPQFILHPTTYLNQKRFLDEPPTPPTTDKVVW